jgi:hypothetical protein
LQSWFSELGGPRRDEALATFAYQNVTREAFALFKGLDGNYYVIGFNDLCGELKSGDPAVQINKEHREILRQCLEPISENGSLLVDLNLSELK